MKVGKWIHRMGAVGVEMLAVLVLGWCLSVAHPGGDVDRPQGADAPLDVAVKPHSTEIEEAYVSDQLQRAGNGLLDKVVDHLASLFEVTEEA